MRSMTAEKVIECLEDIFCRHSLLMILKSDNGTQFVSQEFATYCAALEQQMAKWKDRTSLF